jgi:uncharacterized repeat protein (TIGR01451 family)
MTTDDEWDLYAAGYDEDGNYVGPATVDWIVSGDPEPIGVVDPDTDSSSTTLDATTVGTGQVTADHATALDDTTGTITVRPGILAYFEFDVVASPQVAGEAFGITITAFDAEDNVKTDYVGPASLSDTTDTIAPTTTGAFTAGVWTGDVTISGADTGVTITATDGEVTGTSNPFEVVAGELDYIVISPQEATVLAGSQQDYASEAFDEFDNSRGDVTDETVFEIVEPGDGGTWDGNVYTSENYGTWTVQGDYGGVTDTATLIVQDTDLGFAKTDDRDEPVEAGDTLTYTLTYTNNGNRAAVGVVITDTLPNYVEYVDCEILEGQGSCRDADGQVIFSRETDGITIPAGGRGQARLTVQVLDPLPAGAHSILNRARLTSAASPAALTVLDTDIIATRPDLTVEANHAPSLFSPGGQVIVTVTYGNAGRMDAEGVVITTTLPTGTEPMTDTVDTWESEDGVTYTYLVNGDGDLPAGTTGRTVQFVLRHPDQPEIGAPRFGVPFVIAADAYTGGEADPGDNTVNHVIGVPDLIITGFQVDPWPLEPDVPTVFTVTVRNQGSGWAWNPDNTGGTWVDIFLAPVSSYPYERDSEKGIAAGCPPLAPGAQLDVVVTEVYPWVSELKGPIVFTQEEIDAIDIFYAKIDNYYDRPHGLVPEYNERNNVWPGLSNRLYLPLIARGQ